MEYELRYYQKESVNKVWEYIRLKEGNPCIVLPTGAGKTIVLAEIVKNVVSWDSRVLLLSHVKELLKQGEEKINSMVDVDVGVYSAGLNSRDTEQQVLICGIQSVYKRACEIGKIDIIIVDEADLIPTESDGMYNKFLADMKTINPKVRVIGLTATPYRLKGGYVCKPDNILNEICYEIGIKELQSQNFLCNMITKKGLLQIDDSKYHKAMGEFIESELMEDLDTVEKVHDAIEEILDYIKDRKSVLVFCINIAHAEHVVNEFIAQGESSVDMVTSKTSSTDRDLILQNFSKNQLKIICNVNVLSVGFDAPTIDCVVMMRPTGSARLYYQQVGRGFRIHQSKQNCLVLDYGGNVMRHGAVDQIKVTEKGSREGSCPMKECPKCNELVMIRYEVCPACGFVFDINTTKSLHGTRANLEDIISGKSVDVTEKIIVDIKNIEVSKHEKDLGNNKFSYTLRIKYFLKGNLWVYPISEWICLEHSGYAREKALEWWLTVSEGALTDDDELPSVDDFLNIYKDMVKAPKQLELKKKTSDKYWSIAQRFFTKTEKEFDYSTLDKENTGETEWDLENEDCIPF